MFPRALKNSLQNKILSKYVEYHAVYNTQLEEVEDVSSVLANSGTAQDDEICT